MKIVKTEVVSFKANLKILPRDKITISDKITRRNYIYGHMRSIYGHMRSIYGYVFLYKYYIGLRNTDTCYSSIQNKKNISTVNNHSLP